MTLLSACNGTRIINSGADLRESTFRMNEVVFVDTDLNRTKRNKITKTTKQIIRVNAESQGLRNTPTGTAEVWVMLRNHTDFPQQIQGRTTFFDSSKAPVDTPPQWKRIYIPPNSQAMYSELSTSSNIAFYRVEIQGAR